MPGEGFYVPDPCELTFANTLLLSNAAISLGNAFISLEISSTFNIFFLLFSFILAWTFISLQIKEFGIMGLSINDSVYSCLFFFLTGLHFFHLLLGLLLLSLLFWSCSFPFFNQKRLGREGTKRRGNRIMVSFLLVSNKSLLLFSTEGIVNIKEKGNES